jgi:ribosomal protein S18 acetylase RimI-like enzyme
MYRAAAQKCVNSNITNHAITFYAHNGSIQNQLYRYGFGLRCIDAIRPMKEIDIKECSNITFTELEHNEFQLIYPIGIRLTHHLWDSPSFLRYAEILEEEKDGDPDEFAKWQIKENFRYFAAKDKEKIIAYIKIHDEGENFIGNVNTMKHIQGAYCFPEYRGQGIVQNLLNYIIKKLHDENNLLLGVDFESFNPTASGFWLKYFTEYTQSAVRRIDDRFIKQKTSA